MPKILFLFVLHLISPSWCVPHGFRNSFILEHPQINDKQVFHHNTYLLLHVQKRLSFRAIIQEVHRSWKHSAMCIIAYRWLFKKKRFYRPERHHIMEGACLAWGQPRFNPWAFHIVLWVLPEMILQLRVRNKPQYHWMWNQPTKTGFFFFKWRLEQ